MSWHCMELEPNHQPHDWRHGSPEIKYICPGGLPPVPGPDTWEWLGMER